MTTNIAKKPRDKNTHYNPDLEKPRNQEIYREHFND